MLAGDPLLAGVLARLRALLDGPAGERGRGQAPVSFRVAPQVLTHLERTLGRLGEDVGRALAAVAAPASVGLADTSLGQEDAMTFTFEAAEKLRRVEALAREVLACELLAARQAWWLRRGGGPAAGLRPLAARLAELVPPVGADRPLGPDVERLVAALERELLPVA
jgi:histidine ammonia-lyase